MKSLAICVGCVALIVFAAATAQAQSCSQTRTYYFPDPHGIPWGAYNISDLWTYALYDIKVACAPPSAPVETCPTCPKGGHPIVLTTGNTYINQSDLQIPGLGGGLSLIRTWNSKWPSSQSSLNQGMFGPNWRSNYEERIFVDPSDHYIRYSRGDGSYWSFAFSGANESPDDTYNYYVVAPANVRATLKSGSSWTLTFQNGEKRTFDTINGANAGRLLAIVDRNGNTTSLTYDGANRLTTVTDPAGRHLNFAYGTGDLANLVTDVTSAVLPALPGVPQRHIFL